MASAIGKEAELSEVTKTQQCSHYKRNCKLQANCCGKVYPCRFCHDEDTGHEMDRHKVEKLECNKCKFLQDVSNRCEQCGIVFGEYSCLICRLFDVSNNQFHCAKCGICRVGPQENFYHCDTCNACLHKDLKTQHKCLANISKSPCPICREFLHTSRLPMHIPKCGHMIHQECLLQYYENGLYTCPLCKESLDDMSEVWGRMDQICEATQMPEDMIRDVDILCQDCHKKSVQKFHTEGLKCTLCGSYNTVLV